MTAPLCLHGPDTEDLQCKTESDPHITPGVMGDWAGTFMSLFSKTMLCFLLSNGSLFIKDQAELLTEKKSCWKGCKTEGYICIYSMFKAFYFYILNALN